MSIELAQTIDDFIKDHTEIKIVELNTCDEQYSVMNLHYVKELVGIIINHCEQQNKEK